MMLAPGAMPPDCSTSTVVSSEPELSLGAPGPPSTFTTLMRFGLTFNPRDFQYTNASSGVNDARVTMPIVRPAPVIPSSNSGLTSYSPSKSSTVRSPNLDASVVPLPGAALEGSTAAPPQEMSVV